MLTALNFTPNLLNKIVSHAEAPLREMKAVKAAKAEGIAQKNM